MLKDLFMGLSQNQLLNSAAKKYGLKLGAQNVVAGTNIEETIKSIKELNSHGISCTVDNLGEFVYEKEEATEAKEQILKVIEAIHENNVDAHISLKPTQLGLDIDYTFCLNNLEEIVEKASKYNIHVNIDMEDNSHLQPSFDLLDELSRNYDNVGTVIQAYFYRAEEDIQKYKNFRLRIVKGAYKEPKEFAYQEKKEIDENFIKLIEWHLLNGKFTSIATHDHNIINHVKKFVKANNIPN
ncbi:proline dehydrogenase family protein, partial [Heyndrickxia sporothermodurans]